MFCGAVVVDNYQGTIISLTALYTPDRYGRRKTLISGLIAMTSLWIMIGVLLKYYPVSDASASVPHGFIVLFIWLFYITYVLMGTLRLVASHGNSTHKSESKRFLCSDGHGFSLQPLCVQDNPFAIREYWL
jgi:hypothetical protein